MLNTILETIRHYTDSLDEEDKIIALNKIKLFLHGISPFQHDPVDCVLWIPTAQLIANDYNPNIMAPQEKNC